MLVVMDQKVTPEEIDAVMRAIEARGYTARSIFDISHKTGKAGFQVAHSSPQAGG